MTDTPDTTTEPAPRYARVRMNLIVELGPAEHYEDTLDVSAQVKEDIDADPAVFFMDQIVRQESVVAVLLTEQDATDETSTPDTPR